MDLITTLLIAIGLSADAFAVSLSSGLVIQHLKLNKVLKIAFFFGGFQALMPVIGWGFGVTLRSLISGIDHWIAFGLLSAIGIKMIYEALKEELEEEKKFNPTDNHTLFILAIATSIDALAVGIGFAVLEVDILKSVAIIGIITFILSCIGVLAGHKFGNLLGEKVEIVGGLTLIGIGCKILIEHLTA